MEIFESAYGKGKGKKTCKEERNMRMKFDECGFFHHVPLVAAVCCLCELMRKRNERK